MPESNDPMNSIVIRRRTDPQIDGASRIVDRGLRYLDGLARVPVEIVQLIVTEESLFVLSRDWYRDAPLPPDEVGPENSPVWAVKQVILHEFTHEGVYKQTLSLSLLDLRPHHHQWLFGRESGELSARTEFIHFYEELVDSEFGNGARVDYLFNRAGEQMAVWTDVSTIDTFLNQEGFAPVDGGLIPNFVSNDSLLVSSVTFASTSTQESVRFVNLAQYLQIRGSSSPQSVRFYYTESGNVMTGAWEMSSHTNELPAGLYLDWNVTSIGGNGHFGKTYVAGLWPVGVLELGSVNGELQVRTWELPNLDELIWSEILYLSEDWLTRRAGVNPENDAEVAWSRSSIELERLWVWDSKALIQCNCYSPLFDEGRYRHELTNVLLYTELDGSEVIPKQRIDPVESYRLQLPWKTPPTSLSHGGVANGQLFSHRSGTTQRSEVVVTDVETGRVRSLTIAMPAID